MRACNIGFTMIIALALIAASVLASVNDLIIQTVGVVPIVYAQSGSVEDIQAAVDEAMETGKTFIKIPEGDWVFDASGDYRVNIDLPSSGLNIFGAGINRTILQLPEDETNPKTIMLHIIGTSSGKITISDITFRGRGYAGSETGDTAIRLVSCRNFRIHHCSFHDTGSSAISINDQDAVYGIYGGDPNLVSYGLIDHCYFYDIYKEATYVAGNGYGYGVGIARAQHYWWTYWEPNIWALYGKYLRNVFIEDCYFRGTRHAVACSNGGVYVFRHNIVEDQGRASYATTGHPVRLNVYGMGACEIYDNVIRFTEHSGTKYNGILFESGSGLAYNNTIENLDCAFGLGSCEDNTNPFYPVGNTKDVWIWNNYVRDCNSFIRTWGNADPAPVENVDYFLHEPPPEKNYVPYTYPHPDQETSF